MATNTSYLGLTKPAQSDLYNIDVFNDNADAVDANAQKTAENLATIESVATASKTYVKGEFLVLNGILYKTTAAITNGASLVVGTNIAKTNAGTELTQLNADLTNKIKIHTANATSDSNAIIAISSSMLPSGVGSSQILQITTTSGQGGFYLIPGRAWTYLLVRSNLQLIPNTTIELKITYYEP